MNVFALLCILGLTFYSEIINNKYKINFNIKFLFYIYYFVRKQTLNSDF
ncbi:MAG: hypothetical protein RLZZ540_3537 [Bacteroidota bacterium]|jgi:hypothetical protein